MYGAAYAQSQGFAASSGWETILLLLATFGIFYFMLIRPQQKKEKQRVAMINSLQKGDKVMTSGGMFGVVTNIKDDVVTLKIGTNTNADFTKVSIQAKIS